MEEKKGSMPMANILFRGEYDKPRDKVEAGTPSALQPMAADAPKSRLGLRSGSSPRERPHGRASREPLLAGDLRHRDRENAEDFGDHGRRARHPSCSTGSRSSSASTGT
jgi:hypothetical protein